MNIDRSSDTRMFFCRKHTGELPEEWSVTENPPRIMRYRSTPGLRRELPEKRSSVCGKTRTPSGIFSVGILLAPVRMSRAPWAHNDARARGRRLLPG